MVYRAKTILYFKYNIYYPPRKNENLYKPNNEAYVLPTKIILFI